MTVVSTQTITNFSGAIIGYVDTDRDGNQQARSFYGEILGTYDKKGDCTKDFYGKILTRGNTVIGLIYTKMNK